LFYCAVHCVFLSEYRRESWVPFLVQRPVVSQIFDGKAAFHKKGFFRRLDIMTYEI
jgi:hypothetical protein